MVGDSKLNGPKEGRGSQAWRIYEVIDGADRHGCYPARAMRVIRVKQYIKAPPDLIYRALIDPDRFQRANFPSLVASVLRIQK